MQAKKHLHPDAQIPAGTGNGTGKPTATAIIPGADTDFRRCWCSC